MANVYTKLNSFALLISYMKRRKPWACFCREEKRTFPNLGRILACLNYEVLVYTRTALWQEGSVQDLAVWGSVLNSSTSEPLSNLPILKQEWNCEWLKHTDSGVGESTTVLTLSLHKAYFLQLPCSHLPELHIALLFLNFRTIGPPDIPSKIFTLS